VGSLTFARVHAEFFGERRFVTPDAFAGVPQKELKSRRP